MKKFYYTSTIVSTLLATSLILCVSIAVPSQVNVNITNSSKTKASDASPYDNIDSMTVDQIAALSKFDGRKAGWTTVEKNQGNQGICWAYAIAATAEANMLKQKQLFKDSVDLSKLDISPQNIDYMYNRRNGADDPLGFSSPDTWNKTLNGAGIIKLFYVSQIFSQQNSLRQLDPSNKYKGSKISWYNSAVSIPNKEAEIKKAIAQNGAVAMTYKMGAPDYYITTDNINYDHSSAIVGWDDTISKTSFLNNRHQVQHASRDGAWIVKNSWGAPYDDGAGGKTGYFYLSYDSAMGELLSLDLKPKDTYNNIYYYNGHPETYPDGTIGNKNVGVIFPVKKATRETDEILKAVSFSGIGTNLQVEVNIYENVDTDLDNPTKASNSPTKGKLIHTQLSPVYPNPGTQYGGYYTLDLNKEISLKPNSNYSVVLKMISSNTKFMFANDSSSNDMTFYEKQTGQWENCNKLGDQFEHPVADVKALTIERPRTNLDKDLAFATITPSHTSLPYGASEDAVSVTVVLDGKVLVQNTEYTVIKKKESDPSSGEASLVITITGTNGYTGERIIRIPYDKAEHPAIDGIPNATLNSSGDIVISATSTFDHEIKNYSDLPAMTGWVFKQSDLSITKSNVVQYIADDKHFFKKTTFNVSINLTKVTHEISTANIALSSTTSVYTGNQIKPTVAITFGGKTLTEADYEITYADNINVSTQAKVIIKGKNYFTGSINKIFAITKANNTISSFEINNGVPTISATFGSNTVEYKYYRDAACSELLDSKPTNPGTYYVKVYIPGTTNYNEVWSDSAKALIIEELPSNSEEGSNNTVLIAILASVGAVVTFATISLVLLLVSRRKNK